MSMKYVHGWYLPEHDSHFEEYFDRLVKQGETPCYQKEHRDRAMSHVKNFRIAVDVGGHCGLWAKPLTQLFEKVISFEPCAEFHEIFHANAPEAFLKPFALGRHHTSVDMTQLAGNSGATHVTPGSEGRGGVDMRPLDSFEFLAVDFLKIDCEGYEFQILRGAKRTLIKHAPVILIEQKGFDRYSKGGDQYSALYYLESVLGYKVVERVADDWILRREQKS